MFILFGSPLVLLLALLLLSHDDIVGERWEKWKAEQDCKKGLGPRPPWMAPEQTTKMVIPKPNGSGKQLAKVFLALTGVSFMSAAMILLAVQNPGGRSGRVMESVVNSAEVHGGNP